MRIVFLSMDDEFAGSMQRYVYENHPEWVVGSVISTCVIYKKSTFGAALFLLKNSGIQYFAEMVRMKMLRRFFKASPDVLPSKLAAKHNVETFYSANINDSKSLAQLKLWNPCLIISTNFSHYVG